MGLPVEETDDRTQAVGVLISPSGTRAASLEWFVSITARSAAAREQTEGLADGRAGLLHRSTRAYVHHALTGILQERGYSVAHTTSGLRIEAYPAPQPERRPPAPSQTSSAEASTASMEHATARSAPKTAKTVTMAWPVYPPACDRAARRQAMSAQPETALRASCKNRPRALARPVSSRTPASSAPGVGSLPGRGRSPRSVTAGRPRCSTGRGDRGAPRGCHAAPRTARRVG